MNLKEIRREKGVAGSDIAALVGVSQQYYSYIENGKRRPSVEVAKRIAAVLDFPWTCFYEDADNKAARTDGAE